MARHTDFTLPDDRLAFGMVSHTDEDQTTYCFSIVTKHCESVFKMYKTNH